MNCNVKNRMFIVNIVVYVYLYECIDDVMMNDNRIFDDNVM